MNRNLKSIDFYSAINMPNVFSLFLVSDYFRFALSASRKKVPVTFLTKTKTQTILLQNKGFNTWSNVTASIAPSLASWINIQGSSFLGDIAPGGSVSLVLTIAPPSDFPSGTYAAINMVELNSSNADTLTISGSIAVTTIMKGEASFTVVNGDVVIGDSAEFINGAEVTINSMDVPEISFMLNTGADGKAIFTDIPAGNYTYKASYNGFQEIIGRFAIAPGVTMDIEAVLITNMVTYSWNVTPTTIEDYYEIKLDMTYNTVIDAPALIAEPALIALNEPAGTTLYRQFTLTNKGLASAFNVELIKPSVASGISIETPFTTIAELGAGQSVVVPLKIYIIHTSCEQLQLTVKAENMCVRGDFVDIIANAIKIINGGIEKACNTLIGAGTVAPMAEGEGCSYEPKIVGPDMLGLDTTIYRILPDPSENKCPDCDPLECSDFVWTADGDVQILGGNVGCTISANSPNSEGGMLKATFAGSKQINPCLITDITVKPVPLIAGGTAYRITSGKGPNLKYEATIKPPGCTANIKWTLGSDDITTMPGVGTIDGSGKTAIFTPERPQDAGTKSVSIKATDTRTERFGHSGATVKPLGIEIKSITTPCDKLVAPYKCDNHSFISMYDYILSISSITPEAAHDAFKGNIRWAGNMSEH